jgi:hypothetical protein
MVPLGAPNLLLLWGEEFNSVIYFEKIEKRSEK